MKCYIAITYLLVARHVENDEVALHFIFEIKTSLTRIAT